MSPSIPCPGQLPGHSSTSQLPAARRYSFANIAILCTIHADIDPFLAPSISLHRSCPVPAARCKLGQTSKMQCTDQRGRLFALGSPSPCCRVMLCSLRIALDPVLRILLELLAVLSVLVGNRWLDSVIRVWLDEERLNEAKDRDNLVRRLPLVGTQQTQAHGALVVVADIGMVDLGAERHDWRLEGILVGECDIELEVSALRNISFASYCRECA